MIKQMDILKCSEASFIWCIWAFFFWRGPLSAFFLVGSLGSSPFVRSHSLQGHVTETSKYFGNDGVRQNGCELTDFVKTVLKWRTPSKRCRNDGNALKSFWIGKKIWKSIQFWMMPSKLLQNDGDRQNRFKMTECVSLKTKMTEFGFYDSIEKITPSFSIFEMTHSVILKCPFWRSPSFRSEFDGVRQIASEMTESTRWDSRHWRQTHLKQALVRKTTRQFEARLFTPLRFFASLSRLRSRRLWPWYLFLSILSG